ncbi:Protein of unknown function [Pyronema omphalodes CBS 100304]|uniref:Uncharacterized protein n=1 Tax=Pyronema omphalodes (strain CBS 100304) TaxID=1076935 RepID=U4LIK7_PYROM|nr:Protein of unknown function [Pyronema omphalodes CBS 100304]
MFNTRSYTLYRKNTTLQHRSWMFHAGNNPTDYNGSHYHQPDLQNGIAND